MTRQAPLNTEGLAFADDGTALLVTSEDRWRSLRRNKSLSFSAADSFDGCPGKWVGSQSFRGAEAPDPLRANNLGTVVHAGMEGVDQVDAGLRTPELAARIARAWVATMRSLPADTEDMPAVVLDWLEGESSAYNLNKNSDYTLLDADTEPKLWAHVDQSFATAFMLEDHQSLDIVGTEYSFKGVPIGGGGNARCSGEIDRVTRLPDGTLMIGDYKDGKYSKPFGDNRDNKEDQLLLYSAVAGNLPAIADEGAVSAARIIYTNAEYGNRLVDYPPTPERLANSVGWFVDTYDQILDAHAANEFELKPTPLCAWCPLAQVCPSAQIGSPKRVQRVREADAAIAEGRTPAGKPEYLEKDRESVAKAEKSALGQPDPARLPIPMASRAQKLPARPRELQFGSNQAAVIDLAPTPAHPSPAPRIGGAAEAPAPQERPTMTSTATQTGIQVRPESKPADELVPYQGGMALNLNSYAATRVFGLASLSYEHVKAHSPVADSDSIKNFAHLLADIVKRAEATLTGHGSWQSGANTRVTGLLRESLVQVPAPFGQDRDTWARWHFETGTRITFLAQTALEVYSNENVGVNADPFIDQLAAGQANQAAAQASSAPFQQH